MFETIKAALGLQPKPQGHFGWVPDVIDERDHNFATLFSLAPIMPAVAILPSVDLRPGMPPVYDQGQLGACTAHAICAAIQFDQKKQNLPSLPLSRMFLYYNERAIEGTIGQDAGASLRDGMKSINQLGVPPEMFWPYNITKFAVKPNSTAYGQAAKHKAIRYASVTQDANGIKTALSSGFPVIFGFRVFPSFETAEVARTGIAPLPGGHERSIGGHAVIIVGYDTAAGTYLVRNSWGASWGMGGYFTLPFSYVENPGLSFDFWALTLTS
jgi:C1A family cysteine protease